LYNGLLHTPGFSELDFSTLKIASAGGMSVQTSVAEKWKSITGCTMIEGYGLSETSPVLTSNPFNIAEHKGTIGIPISSTDVSIRDEDGNEVPIRESGELCARGPQIMQGYWRQDEATREVMTDDGFFRTGDIAFIDEQGFCTIIDRKKDMILVSGFNVYPNEVEDVVASMDDILECACIGVPDEKSGEAVMLFVVLKPDTNLDEDEILTWCKKQLAAYKIPRRFEFVQDLPKSNVGKILRRELRDMISAR
jgi:long-chain acyl-CoA synthetase